MRRRLKDKDFHESQIAINELAQESGVPRLSL